MVYFSQREENNEKTLLSYLTENLGLSIDSRDEIVGPTLEELGDSTKFIETLRIRGRDNPNLNKGKLYEKIAEYLAANGFELNPEDHEKLRKGPIGHIPLHLEMRKKGENYALATSVMRDNVFVFLIKPDKDH